MTNKEWNEKYPFLKVIGFSGELLSDEYSWIDCMPEVWQESFGVQLCDDLAAAIKEDNVEDFEILDLKEKWYALRIYTNCDSPKVNEVIEKYEKMSQCIGI